MVQAKEKLRAVMHWLVPPKDRSYKDPYALVIRLARERNVYWTWGLVLLAVSILTVAVAHVPRLEPFPLPIRDAALALAFGIGVGAGMVIGLGMAATWCKESLASVRPLPRPVADGQRQTSTIPSASPAAAKTFQGVGASSR